MAIKFSNYQIIKKCNGNGENKIYIVREKKNKEFYIIKIVELVDEERQLREIEIHKNLNHKYVVDLLDHEIRDNNLIMLIEFAKYGDLFSFLRKMTDYDERKIIKFFYKIIQSI